MARSVMQGFLSKLSPKLIFSNANELNVTAWDLGEAMLSGSIDDEIVSRLKTATGTVASLNISVSVTINVPILKTVSAFEEWNSRILKNAYIGGTCVFYDDANHPYTLTDISISLKEIPSANGQEPAANFIVAGNLLVNTEALGVI